MNGSFESSRSAQYSATFANAVNAVKAVKAGF